MKTPGEDKYIQVPKRIASHLRLFSEADLKTYLGVLHFLGSERGWAFTTLTDLAGYVGLSARSIKKSLGRLLAFGYVKYRFGKGQNAKGSSSWPRRSSGEPPAALRPTFPRGQVSLFRHRHLILRQLKGK